MQSTGVAPYARTASPTSCAAPPCCRTRTHRRQARWHQATGSVETTTSVVEAEKPEPTGRIARLKASKQGVQAVQELQKPLADYMALPASQYSVLDARTVERISETTFRCYVGQLRLFGWSAEPVLTVSVTVEPGLGCTIRLLSCEIKGSPLVEDINRKFTAQMVNQVRWRGESDGDKDIISNTSLEVVLQIPGWCGFLPTESVESVGSSVLQNVLNVMVPRFLKQLQTDYILWATDAPRKPVSGSLQ